MAQSVRSESARVDRRRRRNRQALLRAARRLMAERGFAGATIADITEAADLGFGTFYLYFESKEHILNAVLDEGFGSMLSRLQDGDADRLPAWDALRLVTEQFVGAARENADLFAILFRYGADLKRSARSFGEAFTERIEAVLERGMREGTMRPVPAPLVARALSGLYVQALLSRGGNQRWSSEEIVDVLLPIVRYGLCVDEGESKETAS